MAARIIIWSLNNRWLVIAIALAVAAAGVFSGSSLNFDAFPDTTPVQVQVNTPATALVPEEIERLITFPVELAISGIAGLQEVRSVSQFGASAVIATFRDGTDVYRARQQINERLSTVEVPEGIERPTMGPVATGLGEVFHYTLSSKTRDLTELRTLHDWVIKPKMHHQRRCRGQLLGRFGEAISGANRSGAPGAPRGGLQRSGRRGAGQQS